MRSKAHAGGDPLDARDEYLLLWLALHSVKGMGDSRVIKLLQNVHSHSTAAHLSAHDWRAYGAPASLCDALVQACASGESRETLERIRHSGAQFVLASDVLYPTLLGEIAVPPPVLFYRGTLAREALRVAIVGTRTCSAYGRKAAYDLGLQLADAGVTVVSGLAYGVDKAAHEGALMGSGLTIAVLGSGIDCVYPREHVRLAEQIIAAGGCVMSEFLPWTSPLAYQFPQRNRIISGLSQAVVVMEAGAKSGALITASFALEQDREVLALPGSVYSARSLGTNDLIAQGARPMLTVHDVLDAIGYDMTQRSSLKTMQDSAPYTGIERFLYGELAAVARSLGELQDAALSQGYSRRELFAAITTLEMAAVIRRSGGNYALAESKL